VEKSDEGLSLEEMWRREISLAQEEADRFLQIQHDNGMSVAPTMAPVPVTPTAAPSTSATPGPDSCLGGLTREEYLFNQLSALTNSSLLSNNATPQGRAYQFMTVDPLQPNVCSYPTIDQRYGLATLAYATNVNNWTNSENWLQDTRECEWFGVFCESDGRVVNLTLSKCSSVRAQIARIESNNADSHRLYDSVAVSPSPTSLCSGKQLGRILAERVVYAVRNRTNFPVQQLSSINHPLRRRKPF
jgi:hypothetical protein